MSESRLQFLYTCVPCLSSFSFTYRAAWLPAFLAYAYTYGSSGVYVSFMRCTNRGKAVFSRSPSARRYVYACHLLITFQLSTSPLPGVEAAFHAGESRKISCNARRLPHCCPALCRRLLGIEFLMGFSNSVTGRHARHAFTRPWEVTL